MGNKIFIINAVALMMYSIATFAYAYNEKYVLALIWLAMAIFRILRCVSILSTKVEKQNKL